MNRLSFSLLLGCGLCMAPACAQTDAGPVRVVVESGDTLLAFSLPEVEVVARMSARLRRQAKRTDRITRYVQKVYPYAQITAKLLGEYEHDLSNIGSERDREMYLKLAEAELKAEFEGDLKEMTVTQGHILVKLIDRETGHTGYELVQQLRGSFQAWMWQGIAKLFGQDLKGEYDPEGDDRLVESVVRRIQNGELATIPRAARTDKALARLEKRKARLQRRYGVATPVVYTN